MLKISMFGKMVEHFKNGFEGGKLIFWGENDDVWLSKLIFLSKESLIKSDKI